MMDESREQEMIDSITENVMTKVMAAVEKLLDERDNEAQNSNNEELERAKDTIRSTMRRK